MAATTNRITIERPIADVFAVLTDVEQSGAWFPGNVAEHWTSAPPHGVGSTRRAVVTMFGRRTENDAVVTEYDPPRRAQIRGTSPNAPFIGTLTFVEAGSGTRVEVVTEIVLGGLARPLSPLVSAIYGLAWRRGLATVKRMMEASTV